MRKISRQPNEYDRKCDVCKEPMIGIMVFSDGPKTKAPRTICYQCTKKRKNNAKIRTETD